MVLLLNVYLEYFLIFFVNFKILFVENRFQNLCREFVKVSVS